MSHISISIFYILELMFNSNKIHPFIFVTVSVSSFYSQFWFWLLLLFLLVDSGKEWVSGWRDDDVVTAELPLSHIFRVSLALFYIVLSPSLIRSANNNNNNHTSCLVERVPLHKSHKWRKQFVWYDFMLRSTVCCGIVCARDGFRWPTAWQLHRR